MAAEAEFGDDFHAPTGQETEADVNQDVQILAPVAPELHPILSAKATELLAELVRRFGPRRSSLLEERRRFRAELQRGRRPGFLAETQFIREGTWTVVPPPPDLVDRAVEITGPVDRKMVINALNSGASAYMADFEDSHSPTWMGTLRGQQNLFDAVRRTITYRADNGREYSLATPTATLIVRPRGWHLLERHVSVDGEPIPASLFDFGLFAFHNAAELIRRGSGPYLYLPKMEHHGEASLWNDVFDLTEARLGLPRASIRATVLIETLPAAFEMEEILYALRERSTGLNGGRWDYLFSFIKQFRDDASVCFPDRAQLPMTAPFLDSYARLLVDTCHRRGAQAIGGMAAQIPRRDDPQANQRALEKVVADKERELRLGYDGSWVAHPGLVAPVRAVFEKGKKGSNQLEVRPSLPRDIESSLLEVPQGSVTPDGFRSNVRVALRYLESWFRGQGCVPIDHLMEDAATVEITRVQLAHWIRRGASLSDGSRITTDLFRTTLEDERRRFQAESPPDAQGGAGAERTAAFLDQLVTGPEFAEFFTLPAYEILVREGA